MRMTVADMGDVVDRIDEGAPGMVDQVGAAPAHDLELVEIGYRQRGPQHPRPVGQQLRGRSRIDGKALGREAEDQVGVDADIGPDVPQAVMADPEEVALMLAQHVGHDLEMQMRRPAAILGPVAQMRDDLAPLHLLAGLQERRQARAQMPVERPERHAVGLMFEDQRMAVIERIGVIGQIGDPAGQWRVNRRAPGGEYVDAGVAGAPLGAGGIGELVGGIDAAALAIGSETVEGQVGRQVFRPAGGKPRVKSAVRKGRHVGMGAVGQERDARAGAQPGRKDRRAGRACQMAPDMVGIAGRGKARGLAAKRRHEGRVDPVEPLQSREGGRLRDQQIGIVGMGPRLARRDADAGHQPHPHQVIEQLGLGLVQRKLRHIALDHRPHRRVEIGLVQQRVGHGDCQFVDRAAMADIAKVDQPGDLLGVVGIDDDVVVIGILMQHRGAQPRQARQDQRLMAVKKPLDQRAAGGVGDVGGMAAQLADMVERPQEARAKGRRMRKALQGPAHPPQKAAERAQMRGRAGRPGIAAPRRPSSEAAPDGCGPRPRHCPHHRPRGCAGPWGSRWPRPPPDVAGWRFAARYWRGLRRHWRS